VARAQWIITAVVVEGRSKTEVAPANKGSPATRCNTGQSLSTPRPSAFLLQSRGPHHSPHAVAADTEDAIIRLRKELSKQGLDAGAKTIAAHLTRCQPAVSGRPVPAVSTIWRILS
jgi:hypothetical protein